MVGVLVATSENGVDDEPAPGHLERLESKDFLIGRLDAMALGRIIVVHDHGVETEYDDSGLGQVQPPKE